MRTSRIIEMIYLLLDNRQQKAQDIADYFGVSTKTIYRDVETLVQAGVPIYMQQGVGGGIVLSENYAINKKKLTSTEEKVLVQAIDNIKKLPNAQLEYALATLKKYFNEAGTLWVNTDDISLDIQDKFHTVKVAIIEKKLLEFDYYLDGAFEKLRREPYELRLKNDVWMVVVRNDRNGEFEELYLSRMTNIDVKSKTFSRRYLPVEFGKKYSDQKKLVVFKINELTDRLFNRFPIENIDVERLLLSLKVRCDEVDYLEIDQAYSELEFIKEEIID